MGYYKDDLKIIYDYKGYKMEKCSATGYVCKALDDSGADYQHLHTWFRLFLNDTVYSIDPDGENTKVFEGDHISACINRRDTPVFQGNIDEFSDWIKEQIEIEKQIKSEGNER